MNSKLFKALTLSAILTASCTLFGSPKSAQQFFDYASEGDYEAMLDQVKNEALSKEDVLVQRDADGNTVFIAATQAFPIADKKYGKNKYGKSIAEEYLSKIIARLLPKIDPRSKETQEMLNTQNEDGMTALAYAGQAGLLKIATLLHGLGVGALMKDGSKTSDHVTNKKALVIIRGWEKKDADWANSIQGGFEQLAEDFRDAFSGENDGPSLTEKIKEAAGKLTGSGDKEGEASGESLLDKAKAAAGKLTGGGEKESDDTSLTDKLKDAASKLTSDDKDKSLTDKVKDAAGALTSSESKTNEG